ncbi:MAG TPA: VanW family protein [Herpetosiphonaceae bacterium]|nr:VanW family protein [Herpetosiphonaceae bacterium]
MDEIETDRDLVAVDDETSERALREAVNRDPSDSVKWRELAAYQSGARRQICLLWANAAAAPAPRGIEPHGRGPARLLARQSMVAGFALLAALGGAGGSLELVFGDEVLPGVVANGMALGGLTRQEAQMLLRATATQRAARPVLLRTPDVQWAVPLGYLLRDRSADAADQAASYGHERAVAARLLARARSLGGRELLVDDLEIDAARVAALGRELARLLERPVRDAALIRGTGGWEVVPEQAGRSLPTAEAERALMQALAANARNRAVQAPLVVDLPVRSARPRVVAADLDPLRQRMEALRGAPLTAAVADHAWQLDRTQFLLPSEDVGNGVIPDAAAIEREVARWATEIDRPPEASRLVRVADRVREIVPAHPGQALDRPAAARVLAEAVVSERPRIELPVVMTPPPAGEAEALGLVAEIGRGESRFTTYTSPDRDANVRAGGQDVDGVVVPPGAVFSFNQTVGSITWEKGYRWGDMIEAGEVRPALGGGICQVSTTVFRAAFWSGLEILERHPHSWRLPWYEDGAPPGMDATIMFGAADFRFRNNTGAHILLKVETDLENKRQTVVIYGTPSNRRVEMDAAGEGQQFTVQRRIRMENAVLEDTFASTYTR